MKILVLHYDHINNPWLGGGGAYQLHEIFSRFSPEHQVTMVCGAWPGCKRQSKIDNINYHLASPAFGRLSSRLSYCVQAANWAKRGDYDLLIEGISAFSPTFAGRLSSQPAIADLRLDPFSASKNYIGLSSIIKLRVLKDLQHFNTIVSVSASLADSIQQTCPILPPISIVPPGIDQQLFYTVSSEEKFLLYLGRLDIKHKGLDHLIQAYANINNFFPEIRMIIAGSGPDEGILRKLIKKEKLEGKIEFTGLVKGDKKTELLKKCLFVCMPSRQEGFGQVALEAAACAKPVVGYDITGLKDAVVDNQTGLLVESGNVKALEHAIRQLIANPVLRYQLGGNACPFGRRAQA